MLIFKKALKYICLLLAWFCFFLVLLQGIKTSRKVYKILFWFVFMRFEIWILFVWAHSRQFILMLYSSTWSWPFCWFNQSATLPAFLDDIMFYRTSRGVNWQKPVSGLIQPCKYSFLYHPGKAISFFLANFELVSLVSLNYRYLKHSPIETEMDV